MKKIASFVSVVLCFAMTMGLTAVSYSEIEENGVEIIPLTTPDAYYDYLSSIVYADECSCGLEHDTGYIFYNRDIIEEGARGSCGGTHSYAFEKRRIGSAEMYNHSFTAPWGVTVTCYVYKDTYRHAYHCQNPASGGGKCDAFTGTVAYSEETRHNNPYCSQY